MKRELTPDEAAALLVLGPPPPPPPWIRTGAAGDDSTSGRLWYLGRLRNGLWALLLKRVHPR